MVFLIHLHRKFTEWQKKENTKQRPNFVRRELAMQGVTCTHWELRQSVEKDPLGHAEPGRCA